VCDSMCSMGPLLDQPSIYLSDGRGAAELGCIDSHQDSKPNMRYSSDDAVTWGHGNPA